MMHDPFCIFTDMLDAYIDAAYSMFRQYQFCEFRPQKFAHCITLGLLCHIFMFMFYKHNMAIKILNSWIFQGNLVINRLFPVRYFFHTLGRSIICNPSSLIATYLLPVITEMEFRDRR